MNIKRAKEEIKDTIEAYLLKDEYGAYEIPSVRQRPVLLIGPPGVGNAKLGWWPIPLPITPGRVRLDFRLSLRKSMAVSRTV